MELMSATALADLLGGVVNAVTLRRWAAQGRIQNSWKLPNNRVVFSQDAVSEILQPAARGGVSGCDFASAPLPVFEGKA